MVTPETSHLLKLADPNRGRIVAIGKSPDGNFMRLFAGMGGRSPGSKNRYYKDFEDLNGNGLYIRTVVHDPALQQGDPAATLYVAQRSWGEWHVASNGEQTDGIGVALAAMGSWREGMDDEASTFKEIQRVYRNEGKDNFFTSRITIAAERRGLEAFIGQIIAKPDNPHESDYYVYHLLDEEGSLDPDTWSYKPGEGYFTVTYDGTLDPDRKPDVKPNREQPWPIAMQDTLERDMDAIWDNWDPGTRANLVGKEIQIGSGRFTYSFRSIHPGRA